MRRKVNKQSNVESVEPYSKLLEPKLNSKLICPVCGKEFTVTTDTCYWVKGGYTCSWKCFKQRIIDTKDERADYEEQQQRDKEEKRKLAYELKAAIRKREKKTRKKKNKNSK